MNKLIQSAGSAVLDAVPIASNLLPFVEHVLPLAFGMHPPFRINEMTYCNNTKKNNDDKKNPYSIIVTSYNDEHRFANYLTQFLELIINARRIMSTQ